MGRDLSESLEQVIAAIPGGPQGPVGLARTLGIDKVLASRVLKTLRNRDAVAVLNLAPGPEPLRRLLRAAGRQSIDAKVVRRASDAVDAFEQLIREEAGDRSGLDALLSAWLPEARAEFELRRKQSAFRALSQLYGVMAETNVSTVMLHPSGDGRHIDVVWIFGLLGVRRLRPGAAVKFATRRIVGDGAPRRPLSLEGEPVDGLDGVRVDDHCSSPAPELAIVRAGDVVHYTLAGDDFGPRSGVDLMFAEVNLAEIPRYVPPERHRKGHVFSEISTPARRLQFDVLVHDAVYPTGDPVLHIYDTALDGVADVNDPSRDIDRLDTAETIVPLGRGTAKFRSAQVPRYVELVRHACQRLGWEGDAFRGYRCRIDYPLYGAQVVMAFDPPAPPA